MRLTPRTGRFNWWININLTWGSLSQHIKCSLCLLSSRKQNASFTHSLQGFMKRSFPDVFKGWSHQMPLTQVPWEWVSQPHVHGWHHHVSKASRLTICLKHQGHTRCPTLGCNIMANSLETEAGRESDTRQKCLTSLSDSVLLWPVGLPPSSETQVPAVLGPTAGWIHQVSGGWGSASDTS